MLSIDFGDEDLVSSPVVYVLLSRAGKTSILCHLANVAKANKGVVDRVETAPTIGVQMVEFRRQNVHWVAWDMSGQGVVGLSVH